jgi:uncharacterized protein involved in exopolysaccharide biosynthesis
MLVEMLKRRVWLLLLLPIAAAGTALYISRAEPTVYAANATVVLDYRIPLEGELAGEMLPAALQPSYLSTQIDIIGSPPVAQKVMGILDMTASAEWRQRFEEETETDGESDVVANFESWAVGTLLEGVAVSVGTETRLIEIWYQDPDPKVAAAVANAFVEAYRQITKQLGQNPALETAQSVEELLSKLRQDLEEAENKVSSYQARMGIMASDERLDIETQHLNEVMQQRLSAEAGLRGAKSRVDALEEMNAEGAVAGSAAEVLGNELIQDLQIELARKESELAEMATSLGERHPDMRKLKAEVRSLQEKLSLETEKVVSGIRSEWLQARRLADAAEEAEAAQKTKLIELRHVRDGLQPLLRELESARASYDRALLMYSEYAMHSNVNHTNVTVLSAAQAPSVPSSPNVLRNVASAFFAGLLFALGLALLWEYLDKRIWGKEDLLQLEYLGGLPKT